MNETVNLKALAPVLPYFNCSLNTCTVTQFCNGLINKTFLVKGKNSTFVLQRINQNVFKKPDQLVNNAELINKHLLAKKSDGDYLLEPIWHIPNTNKEMLLLIDEGYWRAIHYIENCYTVEAVSSTEQASQVAAAFAQFTSALTDFSANKLTEIIPDFHNLNFRIEQFESIINTDPLNRVKSCKELITYCKEQQSFIDSVAEITLKLPLRVTHNDTKINNLLFCTDTDKPLAVIDLDTCMPGYLMHDFGDMVRTCCSSLAEDDTNISEMIIQMDIFSALAQAYINGFNGEITTLEKQSLVIGAMLLPFMIGIRFLSDYLQGDTYFHIGYQEHNLDRAKNQLYMYQLLKERKNTLTEIIANSMNATK